MGRVLLWGAAVAAVLNAGPQRRVRPQPRLAPMSEPAIAEGRVLYNRSCTVCHGHDGAVGDRGPALAGDRRYLRSSDQELFDAIRNGIPGTEMPPLGLPEESIWKIVAYIRSLRATAYDTPVKGDPARGEKIFWGKAGCGECHAIGGRGSILGPDLSNAGGQRTLKFLREALTQPKPRPPRGYQPVRVITASGEKITGLVKNEDNFSMQVLDSNQKLRLLLRDELREVIYESKSLMPSDWDKKLAPAELEDLLAFLSRQAAERIRREQMGESEP